MSSNERNINGNEESESYGIDAVTEMSAEEIERLLTESAGTGAGERPSEDDFQGDVLDMLEETGNHDDDLSDIQDMLKKSDRNETIDAGGAKEADFQQNPVDKLLADIEGAGEEVEKPLSAKERKAQEKLRLGQEKFRKAQEKAERAAKKRRTGKRRKLRSAIRSAAETWKRRWSRRRAGKRGPER